MSKRMVYVMLVIAGALLFAGCATTFRYEPAGEQQRMLVARVEGRFSGWPVEYGINLNGVRTSNMEVEIRHNPTKEIMPMESIGGYLYLENPEPGDYTVIVLRYRFESQDGSWRELRSVPPFDFTVPERPGVMNLGNLVWESEPRGGDFTQSDYSRLQKEFAERYHESVWLDREWHFIRLWNND